MMKKSPKALTFLLVLLLIQPIFQIGINVHAAYENDHINTGNQRLDIVAVAQTQVGYTAGDNKSNKYGAYFGTNNTDWCAFFVSWCARQADIPQSIIRTSGTALPEYVPGYSYFGVTERLRDDYTPQPGDLIFFDWPSYINSNSPHDHVGLVEYVDPSDNSVHTIEGNSSHQVKRNVYYWGSNTWYESMNSVYSYGVPNYSNTTPTVSISEGTYIIHNVRDTSKVLDIQYDSTESEANIQLYENLNNQVQKFRIIKSGDYYCIQSVYSGMWLDIKLPYDEEGSSIQLWYSNSSTEQKWIFEDAGDGNVYIHSLGGMYIDTAGGNTANGTNVETYHFDGTTSQQWRLERVSPSKRVNIAEGVYVFHNVRNTDRVLDIQYDSTASGANLQLFDNLCNIVQKFRVINKGDYYCIQSVYSGMWLDIKVPYDEEGSSVQLWYDNTSTEQKWIFEDAGDGNVFIHSLGGMYIDTDGGNTANRTNVETYHFDGTTSQQWKLERVSPYGRKNIADGIYTFHNVRDASKVLGISGNSTANQANIQLCDDLNETAQRFRVTKVSDETYGYYYLIQSVHSGHWLDIASPYSTPGCNVQLWYEHNSTEQKWIFEDVGNGKILIRSLYGTYVDLKNGKTDSGTNIQTFTYDGSDSVQWTIHNVFAVTYDANGGTNAPSAQGKQANIDLVLCSDQPDRTGYNFTGWNTKADGSGTGYAVGSMYTLNADLTLYAQWVKQIALGDANGDDTIDLKDVTMLTRHLAGGWDVTVNLSVADINHDGEVNLKDVVILRRYLAGGWGIQLT